MSSRTNPTEDSPTEDRVASAATSHRPKFLSDLSPSERRFVAAMDEIGFGRFENLRIANGELVLDPWPQTVQGVKFAAEDPMPRTPPERFKLKRQVVELFEYVRSVQAGEIRCLEVRHGLPFSMEVELTGTRATATEGNYRG